MEWIKLLLVAIVGYLLGNISTGMIVSKGFGHIDIRKYGSGNAGSTNVLRTLGWLPSGLTLLGDVLKGVAATLVGLWLAGPNGARLGGTCAIIGHNWPALYGFKGGKGIATSLGMILVIEPWFALALLAVEFTAVVFTRYVSLGSIACAVVYFALTLIFRWNHPSYILYALAASALALFAHRANIQRLLSHTENQLDFKKINKLNKKGESQSKKG